MIAATNMPAGPTDPKVNPGAAGFQTLLAAACAGRDMSDGVEMQATLIHDGTALPLMGRF